MIQVSQHPAIRVKISELRDVNTPVCRFRQLLGELAVLLAYEATAQLPVRKYSGMSPIAEFDGETYTSPVGLVPILRAGLSLVDGFLTLLPEATVYHLGLYREKLSLEPVEYYQRLPNTPTVDKVFLLDPLVATGGTLDWGLKPSQIQVVTVIGSEKGFAAIAQEFPGVSVIAGAIDKEGMVVPGVGDVGARINGSA